MKWKHHGYLLAHQIVATQWLHIYCANILLDLWPLKILAPTWTQIYFFRNASSSTEINQMKWKHHGYLLAQRAVITLKVKSYCMDLYRASYLPWIGFKKMFRKLLKMLNQQDPNFFLFVLLELWFVYHFPRFFFSTLAHKINKAWKWHKIEQFDLWPQFTSWANKGPSSLHLHLLLSS